MDEKKFFQFRLCFTIVITLAIWSLLFWNHFHGGVPNHHILANPDLPSISNWWGGIILPSLTWFLSYRIQTSVIQNNNRGESSLSQSLATLSIRFVSAFLFGLLLAVFFTTGYSQGSDYLVMALLPLALFFPLYKAEFMLGFIIGMTYTFGVVLPTMFSCIVALFSAVLYLLVRPFFLWVVAKFRSSKTL